LRAEYDRFRAAVLVTSTTPPGDHIHPSDLV